MQISLAFISVIFWSRDWSAEDPLDRMPRGRPCLKWLNAHVTLMCTILYFPLLLLFLLERVNIRIVQTGHPTAWELTQPDTWPGGELRCGSPGDLE